MLVLIIGAVMTLVGAIMTGVAGNQRDTWEYQLAKAWGATEETAGVDIAFVLGIIILIVGVLALIFGIIKKLNLGGKAVKSAPTTNAAAAVQSNFKCASCGAAMDETMAFCPVCGSKDKIPAASANSAAAPFCGVCGAKLEPGETFCHQCGSKN